MRWILFYITAVIALLAIVVVPAAALHTQRQQLFEKNVGLLLKVDRIARDQFYQLYAGCVAYPYGRCPLDIGVYQYPGWGNEYPFMQHYFQYHRLHYYQ